MFVPFDSLSGKTHRGRTKCRATVVTMERFEKRGAQRADRQTVEELEQGQREPCRLRKQNQADDAAIEQKQEMRPADGLCAARGNPHAAQSTGEQWGDKQPD